MVYPHLIKWVIRFAFIHEAMLNYHSLLRPLCLGPHEFHLSSTLDHIQISTLAHVSFAMNMSCNTSY